MFTNTRKKLDILNWCLEISSSKAYKKKSTHIISLGLVWIMFWCESRLKEQKAKLGANLQCEQRQGAVCDSNEFFLQIVINPGCRGRLTNETRGDRPLPRLFTAAWSLPPLHPSAINRNLHRLQMNSCWLILTDQKCVTSYFFFCGGGYVFYLRDYVSKRKFSLFCFGKLGATWWDILVSCVNTSADEKKKSKLHKTKSHKNGCWELWTSVHFCHFIKG